jgi:hypothetical protein
MPNLSNLLPDGRKIFQSFTLATLNTPLMITINEDKLFRWFDIQEF